MVMVMVVVVVVFVTLVELEVMVVFFEVVSVLSEFYLVEALPVVPGGGLQRNSGNLRFNGVLALLDQAPLLRPEPLEPSDSLVQIVQLLVVLLCKLAIHAVLRRKSVVEQLLHRLLLCQYVLVVVFQHVCVDGLAWFRIEWVEVVAHHSWLGLSD